MSGWFKLHRKFFEGEIWQNHNLSRMWLWTLYKANHRESKALVGYREVSLRPGQFIFGRKAAATETGLSEQVVRSCMKALINNQQITSESTNAYTIVTVVNWETYQIGENENNQRNNLKITNDQPTVNQRLTTNKNDKKDNNSSLSACACEDGSEVPVPPNIQQAAFSAFGVVAGAMLQSWLSRYPPDWVLDAIAATQTAGAKHPHYTGKILARWQKDGRDDNSSVGFSKGARGGKDQPKVGTKYADLARSNATPPAS